MRPILVIIIACAVLGGVKYFVDSDARRDVVPATQLDIADSSQAYTLELSLSFDAGPDEFSLDDSSDALSLLVQLNGEAILRRTEAVSSTDSPLELDALEGIKVGANEIYVQATPSENDLQPKAIRIRLLQNSVALADKTLWMENGLLQGVISIEVQE